jgi:prevent-host-death family protein
MRERDLPMTQTMKATDARAHWSQLLNAVARRKTRVIVEKSGIPVAAIISADDWDRLQRLEAAWDAPFAALDRTRKAFKDVPPEELEREVQAGVAAARADVEAERAQPRPAR